MADIWMDVDTALAEVPVNLMPLIDDTDFKTIEGAVAYNAAGMALRWHFVTTAGAYTVTSVTPTTGGDYDWTDQGDSGIYTIEIPASGGASINNDTEGFGWFTGSATGILPWRGPVIGFRRAALNDMFIDGGTASTNFEDFFDGTGYAGGTAKLDVNLVNIAGSAVSTSTAQLGVNVVNAAGTAWGSGAITAASVAAGAITAAKFAAGAIDAAAIANNAIDAATFAADVDAEARGWLGLATNNLDTQIGTLATAANLATVAGYLDTEIAAILADTDELQKAITDGGRTDNLIDAIKAKTDNLPTDPADQSAVEAAITAVQSHGDSTWATATSVTVSDKTGFKLASDGLDSVATTAPTGPAANFREMIVQVWRRFFKRSTRTYSGGTQQIVTYADNGTTPVTTQTISDDGTTETQGVAS